MLVAAAWAAAWATTTHLFFAFFALFLRWTPWRVFEVKAPEQVAGLRRKVAKHASYKSEDKRGAGLFAMRGAVGFIYEKENDRGHSVFRVYVLCRKATFRGLLGKLPGSAVL